MGLKPRHSTIHHQDDWVHAGLKKSNPSDQKEEFPVLFASQKPDAVINAIEDQGHCSRHDRRC